jgi:hypothetical protein
MRNWNTDTSSFNSSKDKRLWELSQLINYGLDGEKLNRKELEENWPSLKPQLDQERARMIEYMIWGRAYSLGSSKKFWGLSPKKNS